MYHHYTKIHQATANLSIAHDAIDEDFRKLTLTLAKKLVFALEKLEDVVMRYVVEVRL